MDMDHNEGNNNYNVVVDNPDETNYHGNTDPCSNSSSDSGSDTDDNMEWMISNRRTSGRIPRNLSNGRFTPRVSWTSKELSELLRRFHDVYHKLPHMYKRQGCAAITIDTRTTSSCYQKLRRMAHDLQSNTISSKCLRLIDTYTTREVLCGTFGLAPNPFLKMVGVCRKRSREEISHARDDEPEPPRKRPALPVTTEQNLAPRPTNIPIADNLPFSLPALIKPMVVVHPSIIHRRASSAFTMVSPSTNSRAWAEASYPGITHYQAHSVTQRYPPMYDSYTITNFESTENLQVSHRRREIITGSKHAMINAIMTMDKVITMIPDVAEAQDMLKKSIQYVHYYVNAMHSEIQ